MNDQVENRFVVDEWGMGRWFGGRLLLLTVFSSDDSLDKDWEFGDCLQPLDVLQTISSTNNVETELVPHGISCWLKGRSFCNRRVISRNMNEFLVLHCILPSSWGTCQSGRRRRKPTRSLQSAFTFIVHMIIVSFSAPAVARYQIEPKKKKKKKTYLIHLPEVQTFEVL